MQENHIRFADKYFETLNAKDSAIYAGFSEDTAKQIGYNLLQRDDIQEYLNKLREEYQKKSGINKQRILDEYAKIAFSDIRELYSEDNQLLDVKKIDDNVAGSVSSVEVDEMTNKYGEIIGYTKKVKLHNKLAALDSLGKVLGIFEKDNDQRKPTLNILSIDPLSDVETDNGTS